MSEKSPLSQISNPEPISVERPKSTSRLFVYGILKRGFPLDLKQYGGKFLGKARIAGTQLYHIGGGVGLRKTADLEAKAVGELWEIPNSLWRWLDDIEQNGFCYTREWFNAEFVFKEDGDLTSAQAYVHSYPGMDYVNPVEGNDWHG